MVEKECTYNWDCTPWGLCSGGKQRRNCTNIGTCTGQENKPIEEMQCAMALFDISLNLTNITVVDNKTLQFQLDLKEKQGAEKFDAYIRYTVTDEDENTVFSYTETKAIQNNLSIVKEISDIDLTKGKYKLLVEVFYGNQQRTYAEKEISVLGGKLVPAGKQMNMTEISTSNVPGEGAENPLFAALIAQKDIVMALAIFLLIVILLFVLRDWLRSMLGKAAELLANAATACGAALAGAAEPLLSAARLRRVTQVSAADLVGKKVYSVNGQRIGVVRDAVFEKGKVSGIKVKLDKKYAFSYKGIILEYWLVKSVSEIVIVDETVAEHLKKYLKGKPRAKGS
jgi:sporulation protein YlmC with PRC-barrel domain